MSNVIEVKIPDIGDFKNIPVIEVLVKPGDTVSKEDPLVSLESDKATMEVPSPAAGVVKELKVKVGDKVSEGTAVLTLDADVARERYQKIYARFAGEPPALELGGARVLKRRGREVEVFVNGNAAEVTDRLRAHSPESLSSEALTLEEIFVATLEPAGAIA